MKLVKKIILVFFLLFLFSSLTRNIFNFQKKLQFYHDFKKEYEKEKKKNITLKTEILKKSDPNEVEKTIRNKLNLQRPDEVVIVVPQPTPTPVVITPTPLPNWNQWLNVFF
jgi:cell division protein FtsB